MRVYQEIITLCSFFTTLAIVFSWTWYFPQHVCKSDLGLPLSSREFQLFWYWNGSNPFKIHVKAYVQHRPKSQKPKALKRLRLLRCVSSSKGNVRNSQIQAKIVTRIQAFWVGRPGPRAQLWQQKQRTSNWELAHLWELATKNATCFIRILGSKNIQKISSRARHHPRQRQ